MIRQLFSMVFLCGILLSQTSCSHLHPRNNGRLMEKSIDINFRTGTLGPNVLPASDDVEDLSFSLCRFDGVLPNTFKQMSNLKSVSFEASPINEIQTGAFDGCDNLESIRFNAGNVKTLDPNVFANLANLKNITFNASPIHNISGEIFNGSNNLENIYFDASTIDYLDSNVFKNLPSLKTLSFDASSFGDLKANMLSGCSSLTGLQMNACGFKQPDSKGFSGLDNLMQLSLVQNCIKGFSFANLPALPKLEYLNLAGNHIEELDSSNIKSKCPNFNRIRIDRNNTLSDSIKTDLENQQITIDYDDSIHIYTCDSDIYI